MKGKLFLIPTTLGDSYTSTVLPSEINRCINEINIFIVENIRTARRFIKSMVPEKIIDNITFYEIDKHSDPANYSTFLNPALTGNDIGIISEAGNPGIADPGAEIVNIAHQKEIRVVPLVGPSSILMALIASGLNGQNFAFNGYLPVDRSERIKRIQFLENRSKQENQSQIFMETPFRNMKLFDDIINACKPATQLCIAADITLKTEFIKTRRINDWKKNKPDIDKHPCIFIIHSGL